jgi:hypothetical protein
MGCGNATCIPHNRGIFTSIFITVFIKDGFRRRVYLCCVATLRSNLTAITAKIKRLLKVYHAEFSVWWRLWALISIPFCHMEFNCNRVSTKDLCVDRNLIISIFKNFLLKCCMRFHPHGCSGKYLVYLIRPQFLFMYGVTQPQPTS